jgi:hypothetical protein
MTEAQALIDYLMTLPPDIRKEAKKAVALHIYRSNPVLFCEKVLKFKPTPWQETLLCAAKPSKTIACVSRQNGKSFLIAASVAHDMLFADRGYLAVIIAVNARQSTDVVRKIKAFLRYAQDAGLCPPLAVENAASLELSGNGARVVALAGDSDAGIRGLSADYLIVDEASRALQPVWEAALPFVTRRPKARIALLSTPWTSDEGHFYYDIWKNGDPDEWTKVFATVEQCPLDDATIKSLRASVSNSVWKREFLCEFDSPDTAFFSMSSVMDAFGGVADVAPEAPMRDDDPERIISHAPAFNKNLFETGAHI